MLGLLIFVLCLLVIGYLAASRNEQVQTLVDKLQGYGKGALESINSAIGSTTSSL
jgi:predicted PurR-regulated permease PerM